MAAEGLCRHCGLPMAEHAVVHHVDGFGYLSKLEGADGHLYDPLYFPHQARPRVPKKEFVMLEELQSVDLRNCQMPKLVALRVFADGLLLGYAGLKLPAPEWVEKRAKAVGVEIDRKHRETLDAELEAAIKEEEALRTTDERRGIVRDTINRLKVALNRE